MEADCRPDWPNGANRRLFAACKAGDITAVDESIANGATAWNNGLRAAGLSGNLPIVHLMLSKGANDYSGAFRSACRNGNLAVVELMLSKGADGLNDGLILACGRSRRSSLDVIDLLIQLGATAFDDGLVAAVRCRQADKAIRLLNAGAALFSIDRISTKFDAMKRSDCYFFTTLLENTKVPRSSLADVPNIKKYVFDRIDATADSIRRNLTENGWPVGPPAIVAEYCFNLR
jgi:hypothetical protein